MRYAAVLALALSISAQMLPAKAPVSRSAKEFICSDASGKKIALSSYRGCLLYTSRCV